MRAPAPPYGLATNRAPVNPARFRYPRATPMPPMYSSPSMPTGTGDRFPSSTKTWVFATGRPIGTDRPSESGSLSVAQMVVSVGPYPLNIRRPLAQVETSVGGHASPPTNNVSRLG